MFWSFQELTVTQIKQVRILIDEQMKQNDEKLLDAEAKRNEALREIGNMLHESVIVSNNEVNFEVLSLILAFVFLQNSIGMP